MYGNGVKTLGMKATRTHQQMEEYGKKGLIIVAGWCAAVRGTTILITAGLLIVIGMRRATTTITTVCV
jgi:hypothetical protein